MNTSNVVVASSLSKQVQFFANWSNNVSSRGAVVIIVILAILLNTSIEQGSAQAQLNE